MIPRKKIESVFEKNSSRIDIDFSFEDKLPYKISLFLPII